MWIFNILINHPKTFPGVIGFLTNKSSKITSSQFFLTIINWELNIPWEVCYESVFEGDSLLPHFYEYRKKS